MRRMVVFLLMLFFPTLAIAQPSSAPYDLHLSLWYDAMTAEQQTLCDVLYDALSQGQTHIDFSPAVAYDDASAALTFLTEDVPELCAQGASWSLWYYRNTPQQVYAVDVSTNASPDVRQRLMETAYQWIEGQSLPAEEWEKVLYLYDAVCNQTAYRNQSNEDHTAYGALIQHMASCDGYAAALSLLMRLNGISASTVVGTAYGANTGAWEPHAWNAIRMHGENLLFDATWDDTELLLQPTHRYFALPESWMKRDHQPTGCSPYPLSESATDLWHKKIGTFADAGEEERVFDAALSRLAHGEEAVDVRFAAAEGYAAIAENVMRAIDRYNENAPDASQLWGRFTWSVNPTQQCILLKISSEEAE